MFLNLLFRSKLGQNLFKAITGVRIIDFWVFKAGLGLSIQLNILPEVVSRSSSEISKGFKLVKD
jgi:hypothetical protein